LSVQSFSGILCDVLKVSLSASETDLPVLSLSGSIQPYVENTSITVGRCLIPRLNISFQSSLLFRFYQCCSKTLFFLEILWQLVYEVRQRVDLSRKFSRSVHLLSRFFIPISKRSFVPIILETTPRSILSLSVGLQIPSSSSSISLSHYSLRVLVSGLSR